jgi:ribosomal protein S18 acetylase RimI-like enzyme
MPTPRPRRLATRNDLAAVHAIYTHPQVVPFLGYDPMPLEDFEPIFAGLLASGAFFVTLRDDQVRGFHRVNRQKGRSRHVAILETLAVSPAEHGTGFALDMVNDALEVMAADGILRVELMVEADNPRGLAFYRKLGFEQEGRLKAAYKRSHQAEYVDEILMAKLLAPLA